MNSDRPNAAFRQRVLESCCSALVAEGFVRFRKDGVDWDLQNGFRCWMGLNTALLPDCVQINPFVGLHVVPIEKLWTRLKVGRYPGKYSRGRATIACHMGELAPTSVSSDLRWTRRFVEEFLPDHRDYFEGFAGPFVEMLESESVIRT